MQSNTAAVQNQPVNFASISVENLTSDLFTVLDGRYVGHDGFVVPKDFDEFHERFPDYIRSWVERHVERSVPKEDIEDWTQDLLIHMKCLPAKSKHRDAGKQDIVQTFDPHKHYGANAARFFNYLNLCLANRFRTIRSSRIRDPLCRAGNVSLGGYCDESESGQVDDEFCHRHSEHLRKRCKQQERQRNASYALSEFYAFLKRVDAGVLPTMQALALVGKSAAAAELLGTSTLEVCRTWSRVRQLSRCFQNGERVPRNRKPNRRRATTQTTVIVS